MDRTHLTLSEAAEASDRSRVTLRRYLDAGRFPNAQRDETDINRPWLIPISDLEDAGVQVAAIQGTDTPEDAPMGVRLAVAEAVAAERLDALERMQDLAEAMHAQAEAVTALLSHLSTIDKD